MGKLAGVGGVCFVLGVLVGYALAPREPAAVAPRPEEPITVAAQGADAEPTSSDAGPSAPLPIEQQLAAGPLDVAAALDAGVRWRVRDTTDGMRGTVTHTACMDATSPLALDFPYADATAFLCVRRRGDEPTEAFFGVTSGQPQCGFDGCRIPVRFDDGDVEELRASGSNTGESIFFRDGTGFVRRVLAAHRLVIEVEFFRQGTRQVTFEAVEGLSWELPAARSAGRHSLPTCVDLALRGETGDCR